MNFKNNCKNCQISAHCCIFRNDSGFTFVSIKDAEGIKKAIRKDCCAFLDYSQLPKKLVDCLKKDDPALEGKLRYSLLDKAKRILRLKVQKDGSCVFLNNKRLCDIYHVRPNICRIFPFWAMKLSNGKIKIIAHDVKPACSVMCALVKDKKDKAGFAALDRKERVKIKNLFSAIKKEAMFYKKNIKMFAERNGLE